MPRNLIPLVIAGLPRNLIPLVIAGQVLIQHSVIAGLPRNLAPFIMLNLILHPVSVIPDNVILNLIQDPNSAPDFPDLFRNLNAFYFPGIIPELFTHSLSRNFSGTFYPFVIPDLLRNLNTLPSFRA